MSQLSPALRKAAVLIAALDDRTATALLAQMPPEHSAKVRRALVELEEIPPEEQQQVLAEFLRKQGAPALAAANATGDVALELERSTPPQSQVAPPASPASTERAPAREPPLAFLQQVPAKKVAELLASEHPQTIAAVVGHLPAEQAAGVLERLPAALATDVLERMAWLGELAPEVMADLARELRQQLAPELEAAWADGASLSRLAAILSAMDERQRERVTCQLGERNASLLRRLGIFDPAAAEDPSEAKAGSVVAFRYRLAPRRTKEPINHGTTAPKNRRTEEPKCQQSKEHKSYVPV